MQYLSLKLKENPVTGNDIVDLQHGRIHVGSKRSRFLNKIFSSAEYDLIESGIVGEWTLWAMKEAVYKAHHRRFNLSRNFNPRKIQVEIKVITDSLVLADAQYSGCTYSGTGRITANYVHFAATCMLPEKIFTGVYKISSGDIKTKLMQEISEKLGLEFCDLELTKDENFIPHLKFKKFRLNLPFSISHHGNYTAFSFQLINY